MFSIGFNNRRKREEILNLKYFDCYPLSASWSYLHEMYVMENISRWILDFWVLHIHSYPSPLERQERKTCTRVYTNVPQDVILAHNTITAKQKYSQVSAKNIIIINIFENIRKPEYLPVYSTHLYRVLLKWWMVIWFGTFSDVILSFNIDSKYFSSSGLSWKFELKIHDFLYFTQT